MSQVENIQSPKRLKSPNSGEEEVSEPRPPSQVLSPDGAAPPVPVASSSPVPLQPPAPGPQLPGTEENEEDQDDDHIDHDVNETQSYHTDSDEEEGAGEAALELLNKKMLHAHKSKEESKEEEDVGEGEEVLELLNKKMLQARKSKEESKDVVGNATKENEEKNSNLESRNNEMLKVLKECKDPAINIVDKSPKPVNNKLKIVSTVQEKPSTSTVDKNILDSSVANRNQEFETPAVADSAMESSSQLSPVIAKSKRQSADQSVRYK